MEFKVSIPVFGGNFASQPLVFAHLFDILPDADMGQVEVIFAHQRTRLAGYFPTQSVDEILSQPYEAFVLLLPEGIKCSEVEVSQHLSLLGRFEGTIKRALL